jgi:phage tail sheath gpL-like
VRIGDRRYSTPVASGATAAQQSVLLTAEIELDARRYMSAVTVTASTNLTAIQDGTHGNNITIAVETIPAGLTCSPTQPSSGATNPDIDNLVAALAASKRYHRIVTQYDIAADLLKIETEASDRWDGDRGLPCMVYTATSGVIATLQSYGAARNNRTSVVMGTGTSPTPSWIWAAQVAGASAAGPSTPYVPRTGILLPNCEAPVASAQFDKDERNTLLNTGISTWKADPSGQVTIDRLITTFQTDSAGAASIAYLEEALMLELALYGDRLRALSAEYSGYNVGANGSGFDSGVKVVTPNQFAARIAGLYTNMIREGRAQNYDAFVATLIAEITGSNPYQLDTDSMPNFTVGLYRMRHRVSFSFGG